MEYPIVGENEFPFGLRCANCDQDIKAGQPYQSVLTGVQDDGGLTTVLTCVYCHDVR